MRNATRGYRGRVAKGGRPCVKCWLAFGLAIVLVLVATNVWNPFPRVWEWVGRNQPLAKSDVVWQQRVGGSPKTVTITGETVIVEERLAVEARSLRTGVQLWRRKADWAAIAGSDDTAVVVVGELLVKGYEVLDPQTGAVQRRDQQAVAVWTYRDALLDVRCDGPRDCQLRAWAPRGKHPTWTAPIPGIGFVLFADNPDLLDTRPLTNRLVSTQASGPQSMPPALGFPIDGRVYVVDTVQGRVVQEYQPGPRERISVIGGRMLRISTASEDGTCYFDIEAIDPANGQRVWRRPGVNLRTANGAGCPHRDDPTGGENVLVGVTGERRETVLDAYDGRVLWRGAEGETVLAVDDTGVLVRAADEKSIIAYEFGVDTPRWSRSAPPQSVTALTRYAAVIVQRRPGRIIALDPQTGRELVNFYSSAKVFAVGPTGMIIGEGRDLAYVRFHGVAERPDRPDPDGEVPDPGLPPLPGDPPEGSPCGGPKDPPCPSPSAE